MENPAQLHAAFEVSRAFPADAQFNAAQRGPNDVPFRCTGGTLWVDVRSGRVDVIEREALIELWDNAWHHGLWAVGGCELHDS